LAARELAWPWLAAERLGAAGVPCPVTHKRFYATASGSVAYLERQMEASDPDYIVLSATLYAFSVQTVGNKIGRLTGTRAQHWAEARFRWFDRATRPGHGANPRKAWRGHLNRTAHSTARWLIGTASESTPRQVWDAYAAAVERLAREESRRIVVIGSTPFTEIIERENPRARAVQVAFNRRLAVLCRQRRLGWIDPELLRETDVDGLYSDALHFDAAAHARVAELVAAALAGQPTSKSR
jgi:lysophospholipase L1-like esterase